MARASAPSLDVRLPSLRPPSETPFPVSLRTASPQPGPLHCHVSSSEQVPQVLFSRAGCLFAPVEGEPPASAGLSTWTCPAPRAVPGAQGRPACAGQVPDGRRVARDHDLFAAMTPGSARSRALFSEYILCTDSKVIASMFFQILTSQKSGCILQLKLNHFHWMPA